MPHLAALPWICFLPGKFSAHLFSDGLLSQATFLFSAEILVCLKFSQTSQVTCSNLTNASDVSMNNESAESVASEVLIPTWLQRKGKP